MKTIAEKSYRELIDEFNGLSKLANSAALAGNSIAPNGIERLKLLEDEIERRRQAKNYD